MALSWCGRVAVAVGLLVALGGCTDADWDRLDIFPGLGDPVEAQPAMQPVQPVQPATAAYVPPAAEPVATGESAPASAPVARSRRPRSAQAAEPLASGPAFTPDPGNDFCHGVAANEAQDAADKGFTRETVQSRYDSRLHQCQLLLSQ